MGDEHLITNAPSCRSCTGTSSTQTVVASSSTARRRRVTTNDGNASAQESDSSSLASESDTNAENLDDSYLVVQACKRPPGSFPNELDEDHDKCCRLRELLRDRPCLPPDPKNGDKSMDDVDSGIYLPQYSCPFKKCYYYTENREVYLHHIAGGVADETHKDVIDAICKPMTPGRTRLCYISEAIAIAERDDFPKVGLTVTRRVLRALCQRYCDSEIYAAACFICAQIRTSVGGYKGIDLDIPVEKDDPKLRPRRELNWLSAKDLRAIESLAPGTLWNNTGYRLWRERYVERKSASKSGHRPNSLNPLRNNNNQWCSEPVNSCAPVDMQHPQQQHISDWSVCLTLDNNKDLQMFGCTEDIRCTDPIRRPRHVEEVEHRPFVRRLCDSCEVPICSQCEKGLRSYKGISTIPMSLANDHYYGYVHKYIVENDVTWLECAAASICWSTMLVFYIEEPHGHLMKEFIEGAQGRTHVRGNLFSFAMAWEDVYRCCCEAENLHTQERKRAATCSASCNTTQSINIMLPRSESTLASLVRVCIRGGTKDLAAHLDGVTMRPHVVLQLIKILRSSGYPGYEDKGVNAQSEVDRRMKEQYEDKYGTAKFIPDTIYQIIDVRKLKGPSIVSDKVASPPEPDVEVETWEKTNRPAYLMAESSGRSATDLHEEHKHLFKQYGQFDITTGSVFLPQFRPQYIGMVHPYTLPIAVGGYDIPGQKRWRRPELNLDALGEYQKDPHQTGSVGLVKLFDVTRGLPQRIEGRYIPKL